MEQTSHTINSEEFSSLTNRLTKLEKDLNSIKQGQITTPEKQSKRAAPRSTKTSYNIPFEKIRNVLQVAEKQLLQEVQTKWGNFLGKLKATDAPAHATIQDSKPAAASDQALVVAFRYEIHCSLFLDNQETVESVLSEVIGKDLDVIPIPAPDWHDLRKEYIKNQEQNTTSQHKEDARIVE